MPTTVALGLILWAAAAYAEKPPAPPYAGPPIDSSDRRVSEPALRAVLDRLIAVSSHTAPVEIVRGGPAEMAYSQAPHGPGNPSDHGQIVVGGVLFQLARTELEVACLLAHELAHLRYEHEAERMEAYEEWEDDEKRQGAADLSFQRFTREHARLFQGQETQADRIGSLWVAQAYRDRTAPASCARQFLRLKRLLEGDPATSRATMTPEQIALKDRMRRLAGPPRDNEAEHPRPEDRARDIMEWGEFFLGPQPRDGLPSP